MRGKVLRVGPILHQWCRDLYCIDVVRLLQVAERLVVMKRTMESFGVNFRQNELLNQKNIIYLALQQQQPGSYRGGDHDDDIRMSPTRGTQFPTLKQKVTCVLLNSINLPWEML